MEEKEFIQLIKDLFCEIDITKLHKVEIMKSGKIKIKYQSERFPNCLCEDTLTKNW